MKDHQVSIISIPFWIMIISGGVWLSLIKGTMIPLGLMAIGICTLLYIYKYKLYQQEKEIKEIYDLVDRHVVSESRPELPEYCYRSG